VAGANDANHRRDAGATDAGAILRISAEHIARGRPGAEELNRLLRAAGRLNSTQAEAVLAGLNAGWPQGHQAALSPEAEQALLSLLSKLSGAGKGQLIRLGLLLGSRELEQHAAEIVQTLLDTIGDSQAATAARLDAARQLIALRPKDAEAVTQLLDQITPQTSPELAGGLIESLGQSEAGNVGSELIRRSQAMTPAVRATALRVLLNRPETTRALLDGIAAGDVLFSDLSLDQKQALLSHPDRAIQRRATRLLERGGGLPNPDREKVLQELLPLAQRTGDAEAGKAVFTKQCAKCHMHGGEGQRIGPDLTGMAVHPKAELLTHLLDPSRSVEGNFRTYTLVTTDGRVLNGMLAGETRTSLELIDTEAKRHAVARDDIEEIVASKKSLMPDGFEKQVTATDIVNLLEFLTKRGKYTPLDLRKGATIVSTRGMFYDENSDAERLVFSDWSPKTFAGVPFLLVDPQGDRVPNVILLHGPRGKFPPQMPRSVSLPVNQSAKAIHLLSGVGGWSAKQPRANGSVSLIVRLHYADGRTEDHELRDGEHFADYIGPFDVPGSKLAFRLRGQQIRYLTIEPERAEPIAQIEFVKGPDQTAPIIMAVTVEGREPH
jgi:putative heme-binding domain-containing protein